jgi:FkbM family methyltransferase
MFDVGANVGQTAYDISIFCSRAEVYCFEPVRDTFNQLAMAFGNRSNFTLVNKALGSHPSQQEIILHCNSELNTLVENQPRTEDLKGISEIIEIETVDRFSEERSLRYIDILKMDVQGWEIEVLRGAKKMLAENRVRYILAEVGFRRGDSDMQYFEDLNLFLVSKGYTFCGFYDQFRWGPGKRYVGFANALYAL